MAREFRVVIVGGGLSGLSCASSLRACCPAKELLVIDKGNSLGGRLLTQQGDREGVVFDVGAQFFTVRSPVFAEAVNQWPVKTWCKVMR